MAEQWPVDAGAYTGPIASELDQSDRLLLEFGGFVESYSQCKKYLRAGLMLDAYTYVLEALNRWAKIVVLESGEQVKSAVWGQVHEINVGVYKLYEEVALNRETIAQRIQLVLLACEFSVMSKLERCCAPLIRYIRQQDSPCSLRELELNDRFHPIREQLGVLLNLLVKKNLIREVAVANSSAIDQLEMKYVGNGKSTSEISHV